MNHEISDHTDPLGAIGTALHDLWSRQPHVPHDVRTQVAIATAEIGANIIEHSGRGRPVWIRMGLNVFDNQVHITFTDNGPPAAIDLGAVSMPDPMAERGRGLALARAVLDQLSYRRDDFGNHWTLVSRRFA